MAPPARCHRRLPPPRSQEPISQSTTAAPRIARGFAALALSAVACGGVAPLAVAAPATPAALIVSPAPGTPDASPQTQISVLGVPRRQIESVAVTGALSGRHNGSLRAYSGARGASFVPSRPLTQGEAVHVVVRVRGRAPRRVSFTVARLGAIPPIQRITALQPGKLQHFFSTPGLLPPAIDAHGALPGAGAAIFLTPLPSPTVHPGSNNAVTIMPVGPGGPMILDRHGRLVWFDQLAPPDVAANLQVQRYRGRSVLTWWQGPVTASAFGLGEGVIADHAYRVIATVRAGNGYAMDLHELVLTPPGDALLTVYSPVLGHLPGTAPGRLAPLLDSIVQEVDVRTGLVTWEWHALGHIALRDSYATPANSADYDAFHINSIQALTADRVLVSARDTSAVYEIDRVGGRVLWTLGGRASSFRLGAGARFYFQHDARMLAGNRVSLFDDEAGPPQKAPSSRGLVLALDLRRRRATVAARFRRPSNTSAESEGSVQALSGGNVFVGFGSTPFFSLFSTTGRLRFDASLPPGDGSYRELTFGWRARPDTRPAVAVRRAPGGPLAVYASWNGATDVLRWQVLAGPTATTMRPVGSAARSDFETRVDVAVGAGVIAVRALGRGGRVIGTSRVLAAP